MSEKPDFISIENLPTYQGSGEVVLLDIRDELSFNQQHLDGAVCMSATEIAADIQRFKQEYHYIIICYHGISAVAVADFMRAHGLQASVLQDGMAAV